MKSPNAKQLNVNSSGHQYRPVSKETASKASHQPTQPASPTKQETLDKSFLGYWCLWVRGGGALSLASAGAGIDVSWRAA